MITAKILSRCCLQNYRYGANNWRHNYESHCGQEVSILFSSYAF